MTDGTRVVLELIACVAANLQTANDAAWNAAGAQLEALMAQDPALFASSCLAIIQNASQVSESILGLTSVLSGNVFRGARKLLRTERLPEATLVALSSMSPAYVDALFPLFQHPSLVVRDHMAKLLGRVALYMITCPGGSPILARIIEGLGNPALTLPLATALEQIFDEKECEREACVAALRTIAALLGSGADIIVKAQLVKVVAILTPSLDDLLVTEGDVAGFAKAMFGLMPVAQMKEAMYSFWDGASIWKTDLFQHIPEFMQVSMADAANEETEDGLVGLIYTIWARLAVKVEWPVLLAATQAILPHLLNRASVIDTTGVDEPDFDAPYLTARNAISALAEVQGQATVQVLMAFSGQFIGHEDPSRREVAVFCWKEIHKWAPSMGNEQAIVEQAVRVGLTRLDDPAPRVVANALELLGQLVEAYPAVVAAGLANMGEIIGRMMVWLDNPELGPATREALSKIMCLVTDPDRKSVV